METIDDLRKENEKLQNICISLLEIIENYIKDFSKINELSKVNITSSYNAIQNIKAELNGHQ